MHSTSDRSLLNVDAVEGGDVDRIPTFNRPEGSIPSASQPHNPLLFGRHSFHGHRLTANETDLFNCYA